MWYNVNTILRKSEYRGENMSAPLGFVIAFMVVLFLIAGIYTSKTPPTIETNPEPLDLSDEDASKNLRKSEDLIMSNRPKHLVSENDSGYYCGRIDAFRSYAKGLAISFAIVLVISGFLMAIWGGTVTSISSGITYIIIGPFVAYWIWLIVKVVCDFLYDSKAMRMKLYNREIKPTANEDDDDNTPTWADCFAASEKKEKEDNELRAALNAQKNELEMYKRMVQELLAQQNKKD